MVFLLLGAGSETTTHLISGSVFELLKDRRCATGWRRIGAGPIWRSRNSCASSRRCSSPSRASCARTSSSAACAQEGRQDHGHAGGRQHGPEANEQPEQLDLERRPNRHLSFGTGIHFCLGHQLARIEAKCALQALFTRWPELELAVAPDAIRWRKRPGLRAIERLPVVAAAR